jgi:hypothetical protein
MVLALGSQEDLIGIVVEAEHLSIPCPANGGIQLLGRFNR